MPGRLRFKRPAPPSWSSRRREIGARVHRDSSGGRRVDGVGGQPQDTPRTVVRHQKSREREGDVHGRRVCRISWPPCQALDRPPLALRGSGYSPNGEHLASHKSLVCLAFHVLCQHAKSSLWTVWFLGGRPIGPAKPSPGSGLHAAPVPLNGSCGPPAIVPRGGCIRADQNGGEMGVNKGRWRRPAADGLVKHELTPNGATDTHGN